MLEGIQEVFDKLEFNDYDGFDKLEPKYSLPPV